jgi:hypothetical protein
MIKKLLSLFRNENKGKFTLLAYNIYHFNNTPYFERDQMVDGRCVYKYFTPDCR